MEIFKGPRNHLRPFPCPSLTARVPHLMRRKTEKKTQAALVAILDEKSEIVVRAASIAEAGNKARASLERQLNEAVQTARVAERNTDSLKSSLERVSCRVTTAIADHKEEHGQLLPTAKCSMCDAGNTRASKPDDQDDSETHDDAGCKATHRPQSADCKTSTIPPSTSGLALVRGLEARQTGKRVDAVERAVRCAEATLRRVSTETVRLRDEIERVQAKEEGALKTMNAADKRISNLEQGRVTHHGVVSNAAAFGSDKEVPGVWTGVGSGNRLVAGALPERREAVQLESELRDGGETAFQQTSRRVEEGDVNNLQREIDKAKEAEAVATDSQRAAEERCGELEAATLEAEKRHRLFRERAENRLEVLKEAFEQEQEERGAEVSLCNNLSNPKLPIYRHFPCQAAVYHCIATAYSTCAPSNSCQSIEYCCPKMVTQYAVRSSDVQCFRGNGQCPLFFFSYSAAIRVPWKRASA